ncbi:MAG: hypothetical protein ACPL0F_07325 [bacterium]
MRQTIFVLFVGLLTIVLMPACQRENALRVVSVQSPYYSDLVDHGIVRDEEGIAEEIEVTPVDSVTVGFQYVEIGPGLPTWTPYQAHIEKAAISFRRIGGDELSEPLPNITVPCKVVVQADPTGKKTVKGVFELFSAWYKEEYLAGYDYLMLEATVKFSGYDDATGKPIEAQTRMEVSVSDFYDDPTRIGQ